MTSLAVLHQHFLWNCSQVNATEHFNDKSTLVQVIAWCCQANVDSELDHNIGLLSNDEFGRIHKYTLEIYKWNFSKNILIIENILDIITNNAVDIFV